MRSITKFVKCKGYVILTILISLILAYVLIHVLEQIGLDIESFNAPQEFTFSPETEVFGPIKIRTKGPIYFNSIGRIYICFSSSYADYFKIFTVEMSLDNASWVDIPVYNFQPNDYGKFADLGLIGLDKLEIIIYGKYYIPPQTIELPSNVSKEDVLNSFQGHIIIKKETAPRDRVIEFLVFLTLFGAILRLSDLLFLRKEGGKGRSASKGLTMPERDWWLETFLKTATFFVIIFLILVGSLAANWHVGPTMISLLIVLCGYVLFLVLPIKRFKLGPTGFEGQLERLASELPSFVSRERAEEIEKQVELFSEETVEPDLLLMRLSIEIEKTLRTMSEKAGLKRTKVGMWQLLRFLQKKEKITDPWLISALKFLQKHRNELVHEGKTTDVQKAIELGRSVLAKLREIE